MLQLEFLNVFLYLSPLVQVNILPCIFHMCFPHVLWFLFLSDFFFLPSLPCHSPASPLLDLFILLLTVVTLHVSDLPRRNNIYLIHCFRWMMVNIVNRIWNLGDKPLGMSVRPVGSKLHRKEEVSWVLVLTAFCPMTVVKYDFYVSAIMTSPTRCTVPLNCEPKEIPLSLNCNCWPFCHSN